MTGYAIAGLWSQRAPDAGVQGGGAGGQGAVGHFARHGWRDAAAQEQIRQRAGYYPDLVPAMPPRFTRMLDGHKVSIGGRDWRVMIGYGHAPQHDPLYSHNLRGQLPGDRGWPRISTNVRVVNSEPDPNTLHFNLISSPGYAS